MMRSFGRAVHSLRSLSLISVVALAGPMACSSGGSSDTNAGGQGGSGATTAGTGGTTAGGSGGAGNASGSVPGGAPCQTDGDCAGGARCLQALVPGPTGYCAPSCNTHDDCFASITPEVAQLFAVPAPEKFGKSYNQWNSDDLWRGLTCAGADVSDQVEPGNKRCLMLCPVNSAVVLDETGTEALSCSCMPHHRDADSAQGSQDCVWDEAEECSIFLPTCTTGTSSGECSSGQFTCLLNEHLDGLCVDDFTQVDIEQCVYDKCSGGGCDVGCLSGCGSSELCIESCCTC